MRIFDLIHTYNIWNEIDARDHVPDLQGWNSESEVFNRLIKETCAQEICEIGTWKGASAVNMARFVIGSPEIVCVDTWLGSLEMWIDREKRSLMQFDFGRAGIYETFMRNIKCFGLQNIITPFPTTSSIAARFFHHHKICFDLIYIDASHETKDVFDDIRSYETLAPVIFGDDYDWPSVRSAVDSFANMNFRDFDLEIANEKWILRKK